VADKSENLIQTEVIMMEIQEGLSKMFTDDPVNWIKWGAVFVVFILAYIVSVKLYGKVSYFISWERKRDIAKSKDHIIKADILKQWPSGEVARYNWHATYQYDIKGERKRYRAYFDYPNSPPRILYLYYIDNPKKVFSVNEYHWDNHKGIVLLLVIFLPWILAALTLVLLKVDISGMAT